MKSGHPVPAGAKGNRGLGPRAQRPRGRAHRPVVKEEPEDEGRPGHGQGEAEHAQPGRHRVKRDAGRALVEGAARQPSRDPWTEDEGARDQAVHNLLHEAGGAPRPEQPGSDGDGRGPGKHRLA